MNHHISDYDLERYTLDMMPRPEMIVIEEHLLWCDECLLRLEVSERQVKCQTASAAQVRSSIETSGLAQSKTLAPVPRLR